MLALDHAGTLELMDHDFLALAVHALEHEFGYTGFLGADLNVLVDIAVGMTRNRDGFLPALYGRFDGGYGYGCAEYSTVQDAADGAVGTLPHLVEVVFRHAGRVRGDGGALHRNAVLLCGLGGLHRDAVFGCVALLKTKVIILGLQVYERKDQLILDHLPEDTGHFVAVHLHEGSGHLDFFHDNVLWFKVCCLRFKEGWFKVGCLTFKVGGLKLVV